MQAIEAWLAMARVVRVENEGSRDRSGRILCHVGGSTAFSGLSVKKKLKGPVCGTEAG